MIRISRGPEPAALVTERASRLPAAGATFRAGRTIDFEGHDIIKSDLFAMQHRKCCYCEKLQEQAKYRDVEHFRPKSRYWWLAWTWDNLLFACVDCNREYKREQFPLAPGSSPLMMMQAPPGDERPLVIDPTAPEIDPLDEIEFRRERIDARERWTPYGLTERGRETIRVCGLDRPGLLTQYTSHVRDLVRPKLATFFAASELADTRATIKAWNTVTRALLGRERPFRALSHDALKVLVPASVRAQYGLQLTRPA